MTGLYIAVGVVLLLIFLLFAPLHIVLRLDEQGLDAYIRLWFLIKIDFLVKGKQPVKKKKKKVKQKNDGISAPKKRKSISEQMEQFSSVFRLIVNLLDNFCKYFTMYRCKTCILVGGQDPADIAFEFGAVNASVYGLIAFLDNKIKISGKNIQIGYDYDREKASVDIDFRFRVAFIYFLLVLIYKNYRDILKIIKQ